MVYYYYRLKQLHAIRMGEWKLHLEGNRREYNNTHYDYSDDFVFYQEEALYNLEEDIAEQRNLVLDYPEIVNKLRQKAEGRRQRNTKKRSGRIRVPLV